MVDLENLLSKMSLEEKLAEITQLYGSETSDDSSTFMGIDYGFESNNNMVDNIGSILGVSGAKLLKNAQDKHLKSSKHKIPLIFMHDVIHGHKTIFPSPLAMSCSWQPELVKKSAEISAKEASVCGIHLTFSPMCDLARDARWGRVVETSGEDPYLNSLYARAYVEGYQGNDISEKFRLASCLKHFAGYSMAEAGRDYNTTDISEYELREKHFPAYKSAVDAGAKMVMTSFNSLNGVPSSANKWLFDDILRKEWGFTGSVISDCTAIVEMIYHGFAEDEADCAKRALDAGVDIEMVSNTYYNNAKKLIEKGLLKEEQIDTAVMRVLKLKQELGLFENPYKDADEELEKKYILCDEHREQARKIACNSMVLLKNDGTLPLNKYVKSKKKIGIAGPFAKSRQIFDSWSIYGDENECESLHQVFSKEFEDLIVYIDWEECDTEKTLQKAKECDVIVLALGEDSMMSGESNSRVDISLSKNQEEFFDKISTLNIPTVVVLYSGRPLAIPNIAEKTNSLLMAWFPGTEGGQAVRDILMGDEHPCGRLTMSVPYAVGQCPIYYNRYSTGRPPKDVYNSERFSSRYVDAPCIPLYPFGYGLTYTKFEYGEIILSQNVLHKGENIVVKCNVKNVGECKGVETVQLYLRDVAGSRVRPIRMLKGFERVELLPNQEKEVKFIIDEEMLKFNTLDCGFTAESGKFFVYVAPNAETEKHGEFIYETK